MFEVIEDVKRTVLAEARLNDLGRVIKKRKRKKEGADSSVKRRLSLRRDAPSTYNLVPDDDDYICDGICGNFSCYGQMKEEIDVDDDGNECNN